MKTPIAQVLYAVLFGVSVVWFLWGIYLISVAS